MHTADHTEGHEGADLQQRRLAGSHCHGEGALGVGQRDPIDVRSAHDHPALQHIGGLHVEAVTLDGSVGVLLGVW